MSHDTHMKARVRSAAHPAAFAPKITSHVCLSVSVSVSESESESLSVSMSVSVFRCVSECKYNHIYTYEHACIRIHSHYDRSKKNRPKKGGNVSLRYMVYYPTVDYDAMQHTAIHCNTLKHTATHCNTLQHTTTHGMGVLNSRLTVVVCRIM